MERAYSDYSASAQARQSYYNDQQQPLRELSSEEERRIIQEAESLVELAAAENADWEYAEGHREDEVKEGAEGLATDLSLLLDTGKFSDVTLRAGRREFRAHRLILAARSPVFSAMFEHDMLEKAEGLVDIQDLDGDVLHQLLRYVYTDSIAFNNDAESGSSSSVILSLLEAADKYSLPKLKKACSDHLRSNLTADMALRVMAVADLHGDEDLKEAAVTTVLGDAVRIMKTDEWLAFLKDYSELANCVILRLACATQMM